METLLALFESQKKFNEFVRSVHNKAVEYPNDFNPETGLFKKIGCMHASNGAIGGMRAKTDGNSEYKAMLSEVERNLTRCYRDVADYYDKTRTLKDGTKVTSVLPDNVPYESRVRRSSISSQP